MQLNEKAERADVDFVKTEHFFIVSGTSSIVNKILTAFMISPIFCYLHNVI